MKLNRYFKIFKGISGMLAASVAVALFCAACGDTAYEGDDELVFASHENSLVERPVVLDGQRPADGMSRFESAQEAVYGTPVEGIELTASAGDGANLVRPDANLEDLAAPERLEEVKDAAYASSMEALTCQAQFGKNELCAWDAGTCGVVPGNIEGSCDDFCASRDGTCITAAAKAEGSCTIEPGTGYCDEPAASQVCVCHRQARYEFKTCEVSVRWGQLFKNDDAETLSWDGEVSVEHGKVMLVELIDWEAEVDEAYSQLDTRFQFYRSSTQSYNDGMYMTMFVPLDKESNVLRFENMQTELELDLAELDEYTDTFAINSAGDHFGVHLTCF